MSENELKEIEKFDPKFRAFDAKNYSIPKVKLDYGVDKYPLEPKNYLIVVEVNTEHFFQFYSLITKHQVECPNILYVAIHNLKVDTNFNIIKEYPNSKGVIILKNCIFRNNLTLSQSAYIQGLIVKSCCFQKGLRLYQLPSIQNSVTIFDCFFSALDITEITLLKDLHLSQSEIIVFGFSKNKVTEHFSIVGCTIRYTPVFEGIKTTKTNSNFKIFLSHTIFKAGINVSKFGLPLNCFEFNRPKFELSSVTGKNNGNIIQIRKSANLFKTHLRNEDNKIDALQFAKLELEAFRLDGANQLGIWDKVILRLNYESNEHGTSYQRALKFVLFTTLGTGLVFLIPFLFRTDLVFDFTPVKIWEVVIYFFQIVNITKWEIAPFGIENSNGYPFLFLGRIAIGYGVYQFIAAFRKYGKN